MEKGSVINECIQRQLGNKFRRSLKEVQLSDDEKSLVRSKMNSQNVKPKTVERVGVAEKENVLTLRRSKRKPEAEKKTYVESPVDPKPSKPKNTKTKKNAKKSKRVHSVTAIKNEEKVALNQSKLNFSPVIDTTKENHPCTFKPVDNLEKKITSSEVNEDSGFDPICGISDQIDYLEKTITSSEVNEDSVFYPISGVSDQSPMNSTARTSCLRSLTEKHSDMISAITAGIPTSQYWKDLAEQRRIALEKALHENELLYDQLAVLEAENSQLKECLKEAENLADKVRGMIN